MKVQWGGGEVEEKGDQPDRKDEGKKLSLERFIRKERLNGSPGKKSARKE